MYAVIDIGSNTIRLKVYKVVKGQFESVVDKKEFAKLISYRSDGKMTDEGIDICVSVLDRMLNLIKLLKVKDYYVIATAPFRNIDNASDVILQVKEQTGIVINVLSGEDEAYYSYIGAKASTLVNEGLLTDIGGGSTELVFFKDSVELNKISLPCGSLNMQKEFYKDVDGFDFETKWIKKRVLNYLNENKFDETIMHKDVIIGVGGTVRALLKLKRSETGLNDNEFSYDDVRRWYQVLKQNPIKWIKELLLIIPERVYTITTGLIILKTVMSYVNASRVIVSQYGVREGYLSYILSLRSQE